MSKNLKKKLSYRALSFLTASALCSQAIMILGVSQAQGQGQEGSDSVRTEAAEQAHGILNDYIDKVSDTMTGNQENRRAAGVIVMGLESLTMLALDRGLANPEIKKWKNEVGELMDQINKKDVIIAHLLSGRPVLPMEMAKEMLALFKDPKNLRSDFDTDPIESSSDALARKKVKSQKIDPTVSDLPDELVTKDVPTMGSTVNPNINKTNVQRHYLENSQATKLVNNLFEKRHTLRDNSFERFMDMHSRFKELDLNDMRMLARADLIDDQIRELEQSKIDLLKKRQSLIFGMKGQSIKALRVLSVGGYIVVLLDGVINYKLIESLKKDPAFFGSYKLARVAGVEAAQFLKKSSKEIQDYLKKSNLLDQYLN